MGWMNKKPCPLFLSSGSPPPGKIPFLSASRLCLVALEEQASGPASFFPPSFSQAVQECCTCVCLPQGGPRLLSMPRLLSG